jgi:hypothetical protein
LKDHSEELVNQRKQTLKEILSQLKHYNENTRRGINPFFFLILFCLQKLEAVLGLKGLLKTHSSVLESQTGIILESIVELMVDEAKGVRQALLLLLQFILPNLKVVPIIIYYYYYL